MKENDSSEWLRLFTERAERKNLTEAELDMIVDFGVSLQILRHFHNDTSFTKYHLDKVQYTLDYFAKEPEKDVLQ